MKSVLFKTAWQLVKELNISISEALKIVWKAHKQGVGVIVNTSWNGKKSMSYKYTNGDTHTSYVSASLETVLERVASHVDTCTKGAEYFHNEHKYVGGINSKKL